MRYGGLDAQAPLDLLLLAQDQNGDVSIQQRIRRDAHAQSAVRRRPRMLMPYFLRRSSWRTVLPLHSSGMDSSKME